MPTAAKLVSAIYMAFASALVILVVIYVYPGLERELVPMAITAAIIGLLVGWRSLGNKVASEEASAVSIGIRSGITTFLWVLFMFALNYMIAGIMKHAYYQPMSAVLQIPAQMINYGRAALDVKILGSIVILSALGGVIAKRTGNKWS